MSELKKKTAIIILSICIVVVAACCGFYFFCAGNPVISIQRASSSGNNIETIGISISNRFGIPASKGIQDKLHEIEVWNDEALTDIYSHKDASPKIRVSGEVNNGKTILRYEGTYRGSDGSEVSYLNEKEFDFTPVPADQLLK
ncbi:MAG: hypothetical protein HUJ75_01830 [Parasporobacterium sp.]|nr:hypothetical protein [Parasporobacterium sp.]